MNKVLDQELSILLNKTSKPVDWMESTRTGKPVTAAYTEYPLAFAGPVKQLSTAETIKTSDIKRMLKLVEDGANIECASPADGFTLLMRVAEFGSKDFLEKTLAHNPMVDRQNLAGETALHRAALLDRKKSVEILLAAGASPFSKDKKGFEPLDLAYSEDKDHDAIIAALLNARQSFIKVHHVAATPIDKAFAEDRAYTDRVRKLLEDRVEAKWDEITHQPPRVMPKGKGSR